MHNSADNSCLHVLDDLLIAAQLSLCLDFFDTVFILL